MACSKALLWLSPGTDTDILPDNQLTAKVHYVLIITMNRLYTLSLLAVAAILWTAATSTAAASDFPMGSFTLKGPDEAKWVIEFDDKQKVTVVRDGQVGVEGTYRVTKDEIEFTDEKGQFAGEGSAKKGTFKWKLADMKLTFTKVKDENQGRSAVLTFGVWTMRE